MNSVNNLIFFHHKTLIKIFKSPLETTIKIKFEPFGKKILFKC
jgi:hypothetical protein